MARAQKKSSTAKPIEPISELVAQADPSPAQQEGPPTGGDITTGEVTGGSPSPEEGTAKPAGKTAAVRMMTRFMAAKQASSSKSPTQRVVDSARLTQKPQAGSGARGPRRGASKGR